MKISKLIEGLQKEDPDTEIIIRTTRPLLPNASYELDLATDSQDKLVIVPLRTVQIGDNAPAAYDKA